MRSGLKISELDEQLWKDVKKFAIYTCYFNTDSQNWPKVITTPFFANYSTDVTTTTAIFFVRSSVSVENLEADDPIYRSYYPSSRGLRNTISDILNSLEFTLPYENLQRDVRNILRHLGTGAAKK